MTLQQSPREETRHVLPFANVNADLHGLIQQKWHRCEAWMGLCRRSLGHGAVLLASTQGTEGTEVVGGEARARGGAAPIDCRGVPCGPHRPIRGSQHLPQ